MSNSVLSVRMLDTLASCASLLSKSLKQLKVNASEQQIFDELHAVVEAQISGKSMVKANASTADEVPPYNIAADMISTAYSLFEEGKTELALKKVVVAFQSEGMPELAQAMTAMNDESEAANLGVEETAAAPDEDSDNVPVDDSDSDNSDDDQDYSDNEDSDLSDFGDDDSTLLSDPEENEDDPDTSDDWNFGDATPDDEDEHRIDADGDDAVIQGVLSELEEPPVMDVNDDGDDDEDDESLLESHFRSTVASLSKDGVVLANKVSLTGHPGARRIGKQLRD